MAAKKRINVFNPGRGFVKSYDLTVSGLSITPGCLFGCGYCYSPTIIFKTLDEFKAGKDPKISFEDWVEALMREAPKAVGKTVYANVMTDPYQPLTQKYTRAMLWAFLTYGKPKKLVIQTRSPVAIKDIKLFQKLRDVLRVNVTIDTNDDDVRKEFSPGAPGLEARWRLIRALDEAEIPVCITCTPTLPFSKQKDEWIERVNSIKSLTHLVVQEFHNGTLTKTSPEAYGIAKGKYDWHFVEGGYEALKEELISRIRVPVIDGMPGFAPFAPKDLA